MVGTLAASPPARPLAATPVDEAAARRSLRGQIARLEGELGRVLTSVHPALPVPPPEPLFAGPRLLGLGELERLRDRLAAQVGEARAAAAAQCARQTAARVRREEMVLAPG